MSKQRKFAPPGYTQLPNVVLDDLMPEMGDAELRVTLAIARKTFGWHHSSKWLSVSLLQTLTGLSAQGVRNGVAAALERGYVTRAAHSSQDDASKHGTSWAYSLNVATPQDGGGVLVNDVDPSPGTEPPHEVDPGKERKKGERKQPPSIEDGATKDEELVYAAWPTPGRFTPSKLAAIRGAIDRGNDTEQLCCALRNAKSKPFFSDKTLPFILGKDDYIEELAELQVTDESGFAADETAALA